MANGGGKNCGPAIEFILVSESDVTAPAECQGPDNNAYGHAPMRGPHNRHDTLSTHVWRSSAPWLRYYI